MGMGIESCIYGDGVSVWEDENIPEMMVVMLYLDGKFCGTCTMKKCN